MPMIDLTGAVKSVQTVMIAGHVNPDGDCVGSCVGLWLYIRDNYPQVKADVRLEAVPEVYRVLEGTEAVLTAYDDEKQYDLFVALDVSDKKRLGQAVKYFETAKHTICVDHHVSNDGFADENLIVPDASSACEVLTGLLDMDCISKAAAEALYTGIICDSGVFKYSSTSHHTMDIAGRLMEKGINAQHLIDGIFYQKTYKQNLLLAKCLLAAKQYLGGKLILSVASREIMESLDANHDDLEGIIDQLRLTKGTEVAVLVSWNPDGIYKYSMRSIDCVDVSRIAGSFGGGGHVRAAGFSSEDDVETVCSQLINMVKEQLAHV